MTFAFQPAPIPALPIRERSERFPVHRIYCVGRNYREHALEMGQDPDREPPFFFAKPADALVSDGLDVPYPPRCRDLHHEVELVVAIGRDGSDIPTDRALEHVFAYGVGVDLTRRDLQAAARKKGQPWDSSKGFDHSAPISTLTLKDKAGDMSSRRITLRVNGELRQEADVRDLIWSVPEIISELSCLFCLRAGDLIFTGTPAGVAALGKGDHVEAQVDGLALLGFGIV